MSVAFTPDDPGTPESTWRAPLSRLPQLPLPGRGDVVVVVAAHPDDESLGAAGVIATSAANGADVRVVVATDGDASHPYSPTHSPARLAAIRRREASRAVAALAPGLRPVFLGMPDGELAEHEDELAEGLAEHLAAATHVLSPWSRDGHPDHEACASATARQACAQWQFPVWAWHWATPEQLPWSRMARVDLDRRARHAKRAAIAAYPSQHARLSAAWGDEAIVPAHVLAHFDRPFETFVVTSTWPAAHVAYFDDLYANAPDPWGLAGRFYERRKRELVIACLPRQRFTRAFEPGCATGELTVRLAERCDEVLAWDAAAAAVAQARAHAARPGVAVEQGNVPRQWPEGTFDLLVLSEVGYYCTDLDLLVHRLRGSLTDDGVVLACHWRRAAPDHPQTAEAVHAALADGLRALRRVVGHEEPDFLLDVWSGDARSVAEAEGIVR